MYMYSYSPELMIHDNVCMQECIRLGLEDSWEGWEQNEAQELLLMLKIT